jgi:hypothetical protein
MKRVGGAAGFQVRPLRPEAKAALDRLDAKLSTIVDETKQHVDARVAGRPSFEDLPLQQSLLDYLNKRRGG